MPDTAKPATQAQLAALLGVSLTTVREVEARGITSRAMPLGEWLRNYCDSLRRVASGRAASDGEIDLNEERALLARSQRQKLDMEIAVRTGELMLAADVERDIAVAYAAIAQSLLSLPDMVERRCGVAPEAVELVEQSIHSTMSALHDRLKHLHR